MAQISGLRVDGVDLCRKRDEFHAPKGTHPMMPVQALMTKAMGCTWRTSLILSHTHPS